MATQLLPPEFRVNLDPAAFIADPELIEALDKRSQPVCCEQDRVLFRQGDAPDGLYILRGGEATLTMESVAGEVVMRVQASAGSLLGLPGLIGNEPYSLTATARRGAEIAFVSRDEFAGLMLANPTLSLKVLRVLAAEVRTARRAMFNL